MGHYRSGLPVMRCQGQTETIRYRSRAVPLLTLPGDHDGGVPSGKDMRRSAETLRKIAEATKGLEDSPTDARLRDRLELAADVLDAGADADEEPRNP